MKSTKTDDRTGAMTGGPNINTTEAQYAAAEKKAPIKSKAYAPDQVAVAKKMDVKLPALSNRQRVAQKQKTMLEGASANNPSNKALKKAVKMASK